MILNSRQIEVITGLAKGKTVKQIAAALDISAKTVEWHSLRARRIIGNDSLAYLVRFAVAAGLVPPLTLPDNLRLRKTILEKVSDKSLG